MVQGIPPCPCSLPSPLSHDKNRKFCIICCSAFELLIKPVAIVRSHSPRPQLVACRHKEGIHLFVFLFQARLARQMLLAISFFFPHLLLNHQRLAAAGDTMLQAQPRVCRCVKSGGVTFFLHPLGSVSAASPSYLDSICCDVGHRHGGSMKFCYDDQYDMQSS